jgi:transcriptional regulator with PAS, ATPase and Fis domain
LHEAVEKGRFREDLYYRVHVFPIALPPLRKRKDDIPFLSAHFLGKLAKRDNRRAPRLTPQVLASFMRYDWPGNIRELENEIERALTLAGNGSVITADCISEKIIGPRDTNTAAIAAGVTLREAVEQLEHQLVSQALETAGGNRSQAARALGLTRQGLLNKIHRYKLDSYPN